MNYLKSVLGAVAKVVDVAAPVAKGSRTAIVALVKLVCPYVGGVVPAFAPFCPLVDHVTDVLLPLFAAAHIGRE